MSVTVTVSIPTVRPGTLGAAIDSVRRQSFSDWELIVVGQGPDPGLRQVTEAHAREDSRIRYLHLDQMGVSSARNAAIGAARGRIIAFTDDDCEADKSWLATVVKCFEDDPQLGFLSGALIAPDISGHWFAVCPNIHPDELTYDPVRDADRRPARYDFAGANFAVRSDAAQRIGGFDECLGGGAPFESSEDLDYMLRAEAEGIRLRSTPTVIVHHTSGARYGMKAVFKHRRSYAVGQGALAAKMTLRGDPRGREWMGVFWNDFVSTFKNGRLSRSPNALVRYLYVRKAYRDCLQHDELDIATGRYKPRPAARA